MLGHRCLRVALVLAALGACHRQPRSPQPAPAPAPVAPAVKPLPFVKWTGRPGTEWRACREMEDQKRLADAIACVDARLDAAREAGRSEDWARALLRGTQLRMAHAGADAALGYLSEQAWPGDLLAQTALGLTRSGLLSSWEVKLSRPSLNQQPELRLKQACADHDALWQHRAELGELPVEILGEVLEPNTFPRGIRPSLRDALSYLRASFIEEQQTFAGNGRWEYLPAVELDELTGKRPLTVNGSELHPLVAIVVTLDDLERFHRGRGEAEAAFEARRVRLELLHRRFTTPSDRSRIQEELRAQVVGLAGRPWWAMGMATLAGMVRQGDAPDRNVRAHRIAHDCEAASPAGPGRGACSQVRAEIERRELSVQVMAVDAPERRSILVTYRNLSRVHFRAYPYDVLRRPVGIVHRPDELKALMRRAPVAAWSAALPPVTDFDEHRAFVQPPMREPGSYLIVSSGDESFHPGDNVLGAAVMTISSLTIVRREEEGAIRVEAFSGDSGRLLPGVEILLVSGPRRRVVFRSRTDASGMAVFRNLEPYSGYLVVARLGRELVTDQSYQPPGAVPTRGDGEVVFFTDRSIYRPGQKLCFKALAFRRGKEPGDVKPLTGSGLKLQLLDAAGREVATMRLRTNAWGTAAGEMLLPTGLLGEWSLRATGGADGEQSIHVEEYRRPTFEARLLDSPSPLRLGEEGTVRGEARYFFGQPVTAGAVRWRVESLPSGRLAWSDRDTLARELGESRVAAGESVLEPDGRFRLRFVPGVEPALRGETGSPRRYRVSVDVIDAGGETASASRTFEVGRASVKATLKLDAGFVRAGTAPALHISRTDLDGRPAPGTGRYRLLPLKAPSRAVLPAEEPRRGTAAGTQMTADDSLQPRWRDDWAPHESMRAFAEGPERAAATVGHGASGEITVALPELPAGPWRVRYSTVDASGNTADAVLDFVSAGEAPVALAALLEVEQASVKVGGTARILATSGLPDQTLVVDVRGRARRQRMVLGAGRDAPVLEIPVVEQDRGGLDITLVAVRDHQTMVLTRTIAVPWDSKELDVSLASFRDTLQPGAKETWTVKVSGPGGKDSAAASAEVLAALYDRSLDALVPHELPAPGQLFPQREARHSRPGTTSGLAWSARFGRFELDATATDGLVPDRLNVLRRAWERADGTLGEGVLGTGHLGLEAGDGPWGLRDRALGNAGINGLVRYRDAPLEGGGPRRDVRRARLAAKMEQAPESTIALRREFAETAFFRPQLVTGKEGTASFSFDVPESVTSWKLLVHALTRDLKVGLLQREVRTVKELMVRPYVPRFLREGDDAQLRVEVNNASERELSGTVTLDIIDPETHRSVLEELVPAAQDRTAAFATKAGGAATVVFPLTVPRRLGVVAFKVTAQSGALSDGELRPVPILPGRMHLVESRFIAMDGAGQHTMSFDPAPIVDHEKLVVTVDAQLFDALLQALPYLVRYPHECAEQTLNRYVSTAILSSLYSRYPAVARLARQLAARRTELAAWDTDDPNRELALEETPWAIDAGGGAAPASQLHRVLDPGIARAQRDRALHRLQKMQHPGGAFPWFPGGKPSTWMTLYVLQGLARAAELGATPPATMVTSAWRHLHRVFETELEPRGRNADLETTVLLAQALSQRDPARVASVFTAEERKRLLDAALWRWTELTPYQKGQLALALQRAGRTGDARQVWDSVLASARTSDALGTTTWPEGAHPWRWSEDPVETQAFLLHAALELSPHDRRIDGMARWLLLHRKLEHWQSTRATAEAIHALAAYLKRGERLGAPERITVEVGSSRGDLELRPGEPGRARIVVPGAELSPLSSPSRSSPDAVMGGPQVVIHKPTPGFALASAAWHYTTESLPGRARGDLIRIERSYFRIEASGRAVPLARDAGPIGQIAVGDEVEVRLEVEAYQPLEYVHIRDPRAAGVEPVATLSRHVFDDGVERYEEIRDGAVSYFMERLPAGRIVLTHRIRASMGGVFRVAPATAQPMYAPDLGAFSAGNVLVIRR